MSIISLWYFGYIFINFQAKSNREKQISIPCLFGRDKVQVWPRPKQQEGNWLINEATLSGNNFGAEKIYGDIKRRHIFCQLRVRFFLELWRSKLMQ